MNYNIINFLPYYPDIEDPDFNSIISSKKEFNELSVPSYEDFPSKKGDLFTHQKLISRILSSKTPYDGILLMHEMGTGKTCSASAIIEQIRKENYGIKSFIYTAKNQTLVSQFEQQFVEKCTSEDLSQFNKLSEIGLRTMTHDRFVKNFMYIDNEIKIPLKNALDNKLIIIDEVHNIRESGSTMYNDYHKLLHSCQNTKIILMSGTPMTDTASEFGSVLNLILPLDKQLPTGIRFDAEFITENNELKNKKNLADAIKGRVSYIKSIESNVTKNFIGEVKQGFKTDFKLSSCYMLEQQSIEYLNAVKVDLNENSRSPAYTNSLQASDFVSEDGKYGLSVKENNFRFKSSNYVNMINELKNYSAKYANSIETIIKASKEGKNSFVFNRNVSGGGLNMFARLLVLFGYTKVTPSNVNSIKEGNNKRFILLTGDTTDKESLIDRFNKEDNVKGSVISVILASDAISEGYSFNNIQVIDIHSPWFNFAKTSQAISRGFRAGSHLGLKKLGYENITVDIYLRVSQPIIGESIDILTYLISEKKDVIIKQIEHLIKQESIDSKLAYERNVRSNILNGTRECDYTDCEYKSFENQNFKELPVDFSTYDMYIKNDSVIIKNIMDLFSKEAVMSLNILVEKLKLDSYIILYNLNHIISNDLTITYKNSLYVLREQNNYYFLTRSVSNKSSILDLYYTLNNIESVKYEIQKPSIEVNEISELNIDGITSMSDLNQKLSKYTVDEISSLLESQITEGFTNELLKQKFEDLYSEIEGKMFCFYLLTKKRKNARIYDNKEWRNTTEEEQNIVDDFLQNIKYETSIKAKSIFDPKGESKDVYYGLYNYTDNYIKGKPLKSFSIFKVTLDVDRRKLSKGKECTSFTGKTGKGQLNYIISVLDPLQSTELKGPEKCRIIEELFKQNGLLIRDI